MRVKLQLVLCDDDGHDTTVTDVVTLKKDHRRLEHLGLTLAEAKQLLTTIQHRVLQRQVDTFLDACSTCKDCGTPLKAKGYLQAALIAFESAPLGRLPVTRHTFCPSGRPAAAAVRQPACGLRGGQPLARRGMGSRWRGEVRAGCGEAPAGVCA